MKDDYIIYLETKICDQAFRIGDLEAALMVALIKVNKFRVDLELDISTDNCPPELYDNLLAILKAGEPYCLETTNKFKELLNG